MSTFLQTSTNGPTRLLWYVNKEELLISTYILTLKECLETGRSITYYQLQKKTISLARFLRGPLGLKKGDTIAVALKNIPEYAVVVLGGSAADLKVTTINPLYTQEEIRRQLIDSKSKIVVTLPELWKKVLESSRDLPHQANIPLMLVKHQVGRDMNV